MNSKLSNDLRYGLVLAALLMFTLAGCGGGDDDGGASNVTGSQQTGNQGAGGSTNDGSAQAGESGGQSSGNGPKAEFIAEADKICGKVRAEVGQEVDDYVTGKVGSGDPSKVYGEITVDVVIPRLRQHIRDLRALSVPPGAEEAASTLIGNLERMLKVAEANPANVLEASGPVAIKSLEEARSFGFTRCGLIG